MREMVTLNKNYINLLKIFKMYYLKYAYKIFSKSLQN